ncbi:MAG: hypothetical protein IBX68_04135 [Dehalococcoidia bacterium]|nr:hypothetical protein [Dehalococcoidia bacterium]
MLYLYENITIVSRFQEEFWKVLGADYLPEAQQNGLRLVGMFMVGIHYNENLAIWEVDDWASLDRIQKFMDTDSWIEAWNREAVDYRQDWTGKILEPAPFTPTLAEIKAGDYKSTIYLHTYARVPPGKLEEYVNAVGNELAPMAKTWGMKLVGCYHSVAGTASSNEVYNIWTAGNIHSEWVKIRDISLKDPAYKEWEARAGRWRPKVTYRFLYGLVPYSPLRTPFLQDETPGEDVRTVAMPEVEWGK